MYLDSVIKIYQFINHALGK